MSKTKNCPICEKDFMEAEGIDIGFGIMGHKPCVEAEKDSYQAKREASYRGSRPEKRV